MYLLSNRNAKSIKLVIILTEKSVSFTFLKVLAWICLQCGEAYFEEIEVKEIQAAIKEIDKYVERLSRAADYRASTLLNLWKDLYNDLVKTDI